LANRQGRSGQEGIAGAQGCENRAFEGGSTGVDSQGEGDVTEGAQGSAAEGPRGGGATEGIDESGEGEGFIVEL